MLRVSSNNVLVVPPFECAWLSGPDLELCNGSGCVSFEVQGENDVTIIFKPNLGGRRMRPLQPQTNAEGSDWVLAVEHNYTVILGSHMNSCLKFEKNGVTECMLEDFAWAKVSNTQYVRYWINYTPGVITVGVGEPGEDQWYQWIDPGCPISNVRYVGLSCWDKHVQYRNIQILPPVMLKHSLPHTVPPSTGCQVSSLLAITTDSLAENLQPSDVCEVVSVLELLLPHTWTLYAQAIDLLARKLEWVVQRTPETFRNLSAFVMVDVLQKHTLAAPEYKVFEAVMDWLQHVETEKSAHPHNGPQAEAVLPLIRFPLMMDSELKAVQRHEAYDKLPLLQELVEEAVMAHKSEAQHQGSSSSSLLPARGHILLVENKRLVQMRDSYALGRALRMQRRQPHLCEELMYVFDGDQNGVLYYIGTGCRSHDWINPVLSKSVTVKASSPPARYTDPKALVSGQFLQTSFAGPRYEDGRPVSYWLLDLGPQRTLACNYYALRQDGSHDFMRDWELQGSMDDVHWEVLKRHIKDTTLKLPGRYASWPVTGHASSRPYRMFRVLLTGPTTSRHTPWNLCLSYFEFYGYLHTQQGSTH